MQVYDLLFELGTEELPPRSLLALSEALLEGVLKGLHAAGVAYGKSRRFATPRRLALQVERCAEFAADRVVERRGPPAGNAFDSNGVPSQAAAAFAKSCGVAATELERLTTDKGSWLMYRGRETGAGTVTLLGGIVNQAVTALPIAKRMRWGTHRVEFVRPVRTLVLLYGDQVVPIDVLGLVADRFMLGHRFHSPRPIRLKSPRSYATQLRRAKVIADFDERRASIRAGVQLAAAAAGGTAVMDEALLDEVTALVEWPVPIVGQFDNRFLALPREVVIATIQEHQRYFAIEGADGQLNGGFVTISNIESRDPATVRQGNERVVRPRLSDAAFFWEQDRAIPLETHASRLANVTFQIRLGSYAEKAQRVKKLARLIGERISAPPLLSRAAELAKADLMTDMVGEFPELQGTMGKYYALAQGEPPELARALEEHYRPRFAGDDLPSDSLGQALALADKLDTLMGIFAIDQRPTGTKDPFGLRRAALGILRIVLEKRLDLNLRELLHCSESLQPVHRPGARQEVEAFITERFRGLLLERGDGATAEMIDAILGDYGSPLDAESRLSALKEFLTSPEAGVLAAINKRIVNILRKAPPGLAHTLQVAEFGDAERRLHDALGETRAAVQPLIAARRYTEALRASGALRATIDAFFQQVMVMDENLQRRNNRLALLREVSVLLGSVADLSRLPG